MADRGKTTVRANTSREFESQKWEIEENRHNFWHGVSYVANRQQLSARRNVAGTYGAWREKNYQKNSKRAHSLEKGMYVQFVPNVRKENFELGFRADAEFSTREFRHGFPGALWRLKQFSKFTIDLWLIGFKNVRIHDWIPWIDECFLLSETVWIVKILVRPTRRPVTSDIKPILIRNIDIGYWSYSSLTNHLLKQQKQAYYKRSITSYYRPTKRNRYFPLLINKFPTSKTSKNDSCSNRRRQLYQCGICSSFNQWLFGRH